MTDEGKLKPIVRLHGLCGTSAIDGHIVYVGQSRVEIEGYSVANFDCICCL